MMAALAAAVRYTVKRAAFSSLEAALVLAAPAAAVRDAVRCAACSSSLEAAIMLAPLASSVRDTVLRVAES